jgi:DNA-binding PadR family transcriptional regulator
VSSSSVSDNPEAGLSELEVALLALLSIRPMTGYEILRHHARALEPWWETPRTQIYPKLRELQRRGLIEHEYVVQESKPNKRLYSIGPAGSEKGQIIRGLIPHRLMFRQTTRALAVRGLDFLGVGAVQAPAPALPQRPGPASVQQFDGNPARPAHAPRELAHSNARLVLPAPWSASR